MTGSTSADDVTLSGRIHSQLRRDILAGRYVAGEALPSERRLSEDLGASRHAVREALKRLQQAGLVAITHGGATRVRDWRHHGGLELLLELGSEADAPPELHAVRAAMEMRACIGADAARRAAARATEDIRRDLTDRAEQLAAVEDPAARNAHYEVLWDLIVDGSMNVAYRLALTTLVAGQQVASVDPEAVAAELGDVRAIRALARAVAEGDAEIAHARARDLLERSIPED
jgi:DNA-binding FadR family transcriptional regulator